MIGLICVSGVVFFVILIFIRLWKDEQIKFKTHTNRLPAKYCTTCGDRIDVIADKNFNEETGEKEPLDFSYCDFDGKCQWALLLTRKGNSYDS